jgi:hypothetical protein
MPMNPRLLRPIGPRGRFRSLRVGLVAYWPMNEDAPSGDVTAEDWTGRGNDLTSNNSVLSVAGKIGNAREFVAANSEYLSAAGANNDLKFADGRDWTYAGWIWVPTWTNGLMWTANDAASNREIIFDLRLSNTRSLGCNLNPGGAAGATVIAGNALALSTWHFFSFTYTHSTGVLTGRTNDGSGVNSASSTRVAGALVQSANPLNLGRRQFTSANAHFGGQLDEVAKWDRVLSSAELDTLYNAGNGIDLRT